MSNVLIRDIPPDDLDQIRAAAASQGVSVQSYLRATVHAQAHYLRRQDALARTTQRLRGQPPVPDAERAAVLDSISEEHARRADDLAGRDQS